MAHLAAALAFPLGGSGMQETVASALRDALGTDVLFLDDYVRAPNGDYQLVGGIDKLRLEVLHEAMTDQGEYKFRPEYGGNLKQHWAKPNTQARRDAMRQAMVDMLARNPRVQSVEQCEVQNVRLNGVDVTRVSARVRAVGQFVDLGFTLRKAT